MSADLSNTQNIDESSPDNVVDMEASGNHLKRPKSLTKLRREVGENVELASTLS